MSIKEIFDEYQIELPNREDINIQNNSMSRGNNSDDNNSNILSDGIPISDIDILDSASQFFDPLESSIAKNILFKRQQNLVVNEIKEKLLVIDAILYPAKQSQQDKQKRRQEEEQRGSEEQHIENDRLPRPYNILPIILHPP